MTYTRISGVCSVTQAKLLAVCVTFGPCFVSIWLLRVLLGLLSIIEAKAKLRPFCRQIHNNKNMIDVWWYFRSYVFVPDHVTFLNQVT